MLAQVTTKVLPRIPSPRILLVDDDPVFGRLICDVARRYQIQCSYFESIREAYRQVASGAISYDVAILDYDLGTVTGIQFANYLQRQQLEQASLERPIAILVSHLGTIGIHEIPALIRCSMPKTAGATKILQTAMNEYRNSRKDIS